MAKKKTSKKSAKGAVYLVAIQSDKEEFNSLKKKIKGLNGDSGKAPTGMKKFEGYDVGQFESTLDNIFDEKKPKTSTNEGYMKNTEGAAIVGICDGRVIATSEKGWKPQKIRLDVVPPITQGKTLGFKEKGKRGFFLGKIKGMYDIPHKTYSSLMKAVKKSVKADEFGRASTVIQSYLGKDDSLMRYSMPLIGELDVEKESHKISVGEVNANIRVTYTDNSLNVASIFLRCLETAGGVESMSQILGKIENQTEVARKANDVNGCTTLEQLSIIFYRRLEGIYEENMRYSYPIRVSY